MSKVIGIDEVGRGAWAGPLVVGAVLLSKDIVGLEDSKKLNKNEREKLASEINAIAEFVGLGWVSASEVDDLGLTKATSLACARALKHAPKNIEIIIDGSVNYLHDNKLARTLINADDSVPAVSAASIVAKVARDEFMEVQSKQYPCYRFESNAGYGTAQHKTAIDENGLTPIHRWSFKPIKNFMEKYET